MYFGSPQAAESAECRRQIHGALSAGLVVLPCLESLADFYTCVPAGALRRYNGMEWPSQGLPRSIVHFVLESLGLEETQRMVFLSHRRTDAMALAEQLHDELAKHRFWPFVDRFDIDPAADVQERIHAALEDTAFVVLIESPGAAASEWVLEEVHHALRNSLGLLIVSFPGVRALPGTEDLPRWALADADLVENPASPGGGQAASHLVLTESALRGVLREIEDIHANAMVRRRRRLVGHTMTAVEFAKLDGLELPGGVMLVTEPVDGNDSGASDDADRRPRARSVVSFTARPPKPVDLYRLDSARRELGHSEIEAVLVHPTASLRQPDLDLLDWCQSSRGMVLLGDHLIGEHWR
jgi:hypothetical protein